MTRINPCCTGRQSDPARALKADPRRVAETSARVVRICEQLFAGTLEDPVREISRTFYAVAGYDDMIVMTPTRFESHCEHHSNK